MPIPILMPALSPTMEEGTLAKWHVKEGDQVSSGDVIAEIETDKAVMEVEAVEEGRVGKIVVNEGTQGVAVNATIAILLEEDEEQTDLDKFSEASAQAGAKSVQTSNEQTNNNGAKQSINSGQADGNMQTESTDKNSRIFASPLARRIAEANGLPLTTIKGTGPHGRIIRKDVESVMPTGAAATEQSKAIATKPQSAPASLKMEGMSDEHIIALFDAGSYEIIPHDNMRRTIASRLVESKQTIPHFYLTIDCELDALLASRKRMNDSAPKEGPTAYKLSVNDFIIKAMGMALQQVPQANAVWTGQGILRQQSSDIGVAVAIEGGLFTPLIRHAELKSLSEISNEMKDLASRARNRRLAPHEYQGGTTSISNLGMYGISKFDAVINPPHSSILAVGSGEKRPVVKDGDVKIVTQMTVTLSCDHRVVDGALGAELLRAFKGFIEDPVTMLV